MPNKTPAAHVTETIIPRSPKKGARSERRRGVIQFHILMRLAYKNLFFKKLRTTLTVMGVVIGIGAIVFLLSFGFGLQNLVSKQVVGSSSVQTIDVTTQNSKLVKINSNAINQIKDMSNVSQIGRSYSNAGRLKYQSSQSESVVYGADSSYVDLSSLNYVAGKNFATDSTNQVLINKSLAKAIGIDDPQKALNKTVTVLVDITKPSDGSKKTISRDFSVSGVFESESRAEAFVPVSFVENAGLTDATQLKVVVNDKDRISTVRKSIDALGFTTVSPLDTINQINQFFSLLRFILLGFGGIGMIIAILGMFNTLTISLLERTREIGLMISLGARKQDVRRLFIVEALLLSVLGGLFGIVSAIGLGLIGNVVLNSFAHHNGISETISAFVVSPTLVLVTLSLSAAIGLVVVYFPARRASQINPIEALKYE